MKTSQRAFSLLESSGYKVTSQRQIILEIILNNREKHMSAEEIHEKANKSNADIGLATVYRALELFEELKIIHKMNFGDGRSRYELWEEEHHHHHLICTSCHEVYEVAEDLLDVLEHKIENKYKFKISGHQLKFYGVCYNCKEDKKDES
ncbi:Fur family transcriptional regulator [Proteinivorax hydrogeniformans]|uniref:Fur family transcriptional regulator n=1 Tax=Proteinivorax hydrogeniformans TaxID=1826727 RepID=A0AAU8HST9_9FIRM